ncbi:hypothetical protein [Microbispora bryophytorum]|uniref:Zinc-ribbon domain-containing protein n=1 Tax=Microbispora bryophytorum subsp. camponoti TaxID=1677852 RepID=A0ABR8L2Y5_9ACTN|nr:hypothetical protein [Microbispora camponoti]MBD3145327.1 hypothetical protein [Microbispora camponoti]
MSDDILSIIPTDPYWQPARDAAERAAAIVADLAPGKPDGVDAEVDVEWHDNVAVIACGANLERIGCPHCGASIDTEWWHDLLETHSDEGFANLAVKTPCCGADSSLDALEYDWPCGFARFEIAVWNPQRAWFSDAELAVLGAALGHPVRQIRAHI